MYLTEPIGQGDSTFCNPAMDIPVSRAEVYTFNFFLASPEE